MASRWTNASKGSPPEAVADHGSPGVVGMPPVRPADGVRAVFPRACLPAGRALERQRDDAVPRGFDAFDRIVVDEVQDLTLVETTVEVELCRAIACGRATGDSWLATRGQTVRPTGFDWGPLNELLARHVGAPVRFHPESDPDRIESIERASERYVYTVNVRPTEAAAAGRRAARRRAPRVRRGGRSKPAPYSSSRSA